jgi:hypothetical protein
MLDTGANYIEFSAIATPADSQLAIDERGVTSGYMRHESGCNP